MQSLYCMFDEFKSVKDMCKEHVHTESKAAEFGKEQASLTLEMLMNLEFNSNMTSILNQIKTVCGLNDHFKKETEMVLAKLLGSMDVQLNSDNDEDDKHLSFVNSNIHFCQMKCRPKRPKKLRYLIEDMGDCLRDLYYNFERRETWIKLFHISCNMVYILLEPAEEKELTKLSVDQFIRKLSIDQYIQCARACYEKISLSNTCDLDVLIEMVTCELSVWENWDVIQDLTVNCKVKSSNEVVKRKNPENIANMKKRIRTLLSNNTELVIDLLYPTNRLKKCFEKSANVDPSRYTSSKDPVEKNTDVSFHLNLNFPKYFHTGPLRKGCIQ